MALFLLTLKAWLIGLAVAAPLGPVGFLCIKKTLETGFFGALAVGFGAALADSVCGALGVLGVHTLYIFLTVHTEKIRLFGGVFLLYLSFRDLMQKNDTFSLALKKQKSQFLISFEVFFLTLSNPLTLLGMTAFLSSVGLNSLSIPHVFLVMVGVFCGSMTWWIFLGVSTTLVREALPPTFFLKIRYFSSAILAFFGLLAIGSSFYRG